MAPSTEDPGAALLQEWVERSASLRSRWPWELLDADHGDLLYDEDGLPEPLPSKGDDPTRTDVRSTLTP